MASIPEAAGVRLWRIVKESRLESALNGEGARLFGGRWNSPGLLAVYASDSLALAALETLVHLDLSLPLPRFLAFALTVPGAGIEKVTLPAAGSAGKLPPMEQTQALGDRWLRAGTAVALRVPSTIISIEYNYLLNPAHPAFDELEIEPPIPFPMDPRLRLRPS